MNGAPIFVFLVHRNVQFKHVKCTVYITFSIHYYFDLHDIERGRALIKKIDY